MFMRIIWGRVRAGAWDGFEAAYKAALAPGGATIHGLRGRWLVRDLDDPDAGFSMSLCDSMEAIRRYEQSAFFRQSVRPALQPFFIDEFTPAHGEVRVKEDFAP